MAYSVDALLPIIQLNKAYAEIALSGFPLLWLYVHKATGFILASFLVAGLSGLIE